MSRGTGSDACRLTRELVDFKMAAIARDASRFAGVKTFSEKFSQPEVDAEGRVRKVGICSTTLLSFNTENVSRVVRFCWFVLVRLKARVVWYFRWVKTCKRETNFSRARPHMSLVNTAAVTASGCSNCVFFFSADVCTEIILRERKFVCICGCISLCQRRPLKTSSLIV